MVRKLTGVHERLPPTERPDILARRQIVDDKVRAEVCLAGVFRIVRVPIHLLGPHGAEKLLLLLVGESLAKPPAVDELDDPRLFAHVHADVFQLADLTVTREHDAEHGDDRTRLDPLRDELYAVETARVARRQVHAVKPEERLLEEFPARGLRPGLARAAPAIRSRHEAAAAAPVRGEHNPRAQFADDGTPEEVHALGGDLEELAATGRLAAVARQGDERAVTLAVADADTIRPAIPPKRGEGCEDLVRNAHLIKYPFYSTPALCEGAAVHNNT